MIRVFLDRLYLFAGYAAGGFLLAIFVLMMLLSEKSSYARDKRRSTGAATFMSRRAKFIC